MATSKLTASDDLDNLPDAVTPPQASRKRTREEETKSALRLYEYNDDFCGQSLWLHIELAPRDANGMFKPEFGAAGKVAGDSKMTKALEAAGYKLRLPGFCMCFMKIKDVQGLWGTHRARVLGDVHALTIANFCRPHLQVRAQQIGTCGLC